MSISGKLLKSLSSAGTWFGGENYNNILAGMSIEFERIRAEKNDLLNSVVPNTHMSVESIPDYANKYGMRYLVGTDADKVKKIISRAALSGASGPGWLQQQIQTEGFPLYVLENFPVPESVSEIGNEEMGDAEMGGNIFYDPTYVPGQLAVNSPYLRSEFGDNQMGDLEMGDAEMGGTQRGLYPYVIEYQSGLPDSEDWGSFFFVSPFADRLATESELLALSEEAFRYLYETVIELKPSNMWAIIQARSF